MFFLRAASISSQKYWIVILKMNRNELTQGFSLLRLRGSASISQGERTVCQTGPGRAVLAGRCVDCWAADARGHKGCLAAGAFSFFRTQKASCTEPRACVFVWASASVLGKSFCHHVVCDESNPFVFLCCRCCFVFCYILHEEAFVCLPLGSPPGRVMLSGSKKTKYFAMGINRLLFKSR